MHFRNRSIIRVCTCYLLAISLGMLVGVDAAAPSMANQGTATSFMARLAPRSLLLDFASLGERIVAVGDRGHILLTDDGGQSWRQVAAPTRSMLTRVFFSSDNQHGWAVGHDAVILYTDDRGESWQLLSSAPEEERPLFDMTINSQDGFAIGAYAKFMVTQDGGKSWTSGEFVTAAGEEDIPFDYHLNRVVRSDTGTFYVAAEAGYLFRSDDGGKTWLELPSPYEGSFYGILSLGDDTLLAYGLRGHLFRSEDKGQSWVKINTGSTALLTGAARLSDGTVVVVGTAGTVLVSTDSGRSVSLWQQPDRSALTAVIQSAKGDVVVAGEKGVGTLDINAYLRAKR